MADTIAAQERAAQSEQARHVFYEGFIAVAIDSYPQQACVKDGTGALCWALCEIGAMTALSLSPGRWLASQRRCMTWMAECRRQQRRG